MESCRIIKNLINLDLIEIIQFCLKIFDRWVVGWVKGVYYFLKYFAIFHHSNAKMFQPHIPHHIISHI